MPDSTSNQDEQFYEFDAILKKKRSGDESWYLIKWKGYPVQQSTWQPQANLQNIQPYVDMFNQTLKKRKIINKKPKMIPEERTVKHEPQACSFAQYYKRPRADTSADSKIRRNRLNKRFVLHDDSKESMRENSKDTCKSQNIQKTVAQYSRVEVTSKHLNNKKAVIFLLTSDVDQFEMSQKQVKILFPTELSIFYEKEVKKILNQYKNKL